MALGFMTTQQVKEIARQAVDSALHDERKELLLSLHSEERLLWERKSAYAGPSYGVR